MINDIFIGGEDPVREPVVTHILPDVLDRFVMMTLDCWFVLWLGRG
jgi:hypothetical protein